MNPLSLLLIQIGAAAQFGGGDGAQYFESAEALEVGPALPARTASMPRMRSNYRPCRACGKKRSTIAKHCQHCGAVR